MKKMLSKLFMIMVFGLMSVTAMGAQKILVTSFGQSADAAMLNVLFKKSKLAYEYKPLATAEEIKGYDIIAIAAGASSKGMGAAGINPIDELKRSESVVAMAKSENIPLVTFHLGGEGRRGKLSDDYVKAAADNSTKLIVVNGGNFDGLFTEIAKKNTAELTEVKNIAGTLGAIKANFN